MNQLNGPFAVTADSGDVGALTHIIVKLLMNPLLARELAERAFDVGKIHFAIEDIAKQLYGIYSSVNKSL